MSQGKSRSPLMTNGASQRDVERQRLRALRGSARDQPGFAHQCTLVADQATASSLLTVEMAIGVVAELRPRKSDRCVICLRRSLARSRVDASDARF